MKISKALREKLESHGVLGDTDAETIDNVLVLIEAMACDLKRHAKKDRERQKAYDDGLLGSPYNR